MYFERGDLQSLAEELPRSAEVAVPSPEVTYLEFGEPSNFRVPSISSKERQPSHLSGMPSVIIHIGRVQQLPDLLSSSVSSSSVSSLSSFPRATSNVSWSASPFSTLSTLKV